MVTIDALKKSGKLLELGCLNCRLHLYLDLSLIAVRGDTPIPDKCCPLSRYPKPSDTLDFNDHLTYGLSAGEAVISLPNFGKAESLLIKQRLQCTCVHNLT